jgi:uroporphyrinogen decarboxylase
MISRTRILTAISHHEPDRVPVDLGATPSSGISAIAYNRLKAHLGLCGTAGAGAVDRGHTRVYDVVQQLAEPEAPILDRFHVDVVDLGRAFNRRDSEWYDVRLMDGSAAEYPAWFHPEHQPDGAWTARDAAGEAIARMPSSGTFFDQTVFPWVDGYPDGYHGLDRAMGQVLWSALAHSPWDHAGDPGFWTRLREEALALRASTDRAILVVCGCNLFEWGTFLRRLDNFLVDVYTEPDAVEGLLEALMERHLRTLALVCEAVGDVADVLRFGDDLGMDSGPFISPEHYRRLFLPRHERLCAYVHEHSGMKTFLHSCGSIFELMPSLIEAGYDVVNPVQTQCRDMEPERLKREFGRDVTFWGGGSDTRHVLNRGTPQQVKDDARRRLEILAPGGGYVFNPIHNILPDVPPENVVALFEAVEEFGA